MRLWLAALFAVAVAVACQTRAEATGVPEPKDYRTQDYRAPTPASLKGARVLTTAEAAALWRHGRAIFVDALAQPPRPANLPEGTLWHEKPRLDIPGSIWLPDTGYGALNSVMDNYFRSSLNKATEGDRSRTLVFYCKKDCWMSWNAAKRALSFGYTQVAWYPDGTDGWQSAGLPLESATPVPRPAG